MKYPKSLQDLIDAYMILPGVGPKTAERFAFFTIQKMTNESAEKFSKAILNAKEHMKKCNVCGNMSEEDMCEICKDKNRSNTIMVVESSKEVNVFEKTGKYNGKYHVLNGLISPLNGVNAEQINVENLFSRIESENIKKVIISTSATIPGEMTAIYIKNSLENKDVEVYRIGYGLPAGGDIEYADEVTLIRALEGAKKF